VIGVDIDTSTNKSFQTMLIPVLRCRIGTEKNTIFLIYFISKSSKLN